MGASKRDQDAEDEARDNPEVVARDDNTAPESTNRAESEAAEEPVVEEIRSEIDLGEYVIESDITDDENEDEDEEETGTCEGDKKRRKMNRERKG